MMKIKSYSIERIKPDKSYAIWVHLEPNILTPLAYLRKPKKLSDQQWERIIDRIRLDATAGFYEDIMEMENEQ